MSEEQPFVLCELCELPHRPTATVCDRCEHQLGTTPNWAALQAELPELRKKMALGALVLVAMIVANWMFLGGVGAILLTAPIGWILFSGYRHKVLSDRLEDAQRTGRISAPSDDA